LSEVTRLAQHSLDLYYIAIANNEVLAYGILRGWDEGHKIPSLGIAVRKDMRGTGLARAMMYFLHAVAKLNGAENIRLKVHKNNKVAKLLYTKLGYEFIGKQGDEMIGLLKL